jgi:hypothetical protein
MMDAPFRKEAILVEERSMCLAEVRIEVFTVPNLSLQRLPARPEISGTDEFSRELQGARRGKDATALGLEILISNVSVVEPRQLTGRPPLSGEISAHVSDPVRLKIGF